MQLERPNWWFRTYNQPWLDPRSTTTGEVIKVIIVGSTTDRSLGTDPDAYSSEALKLTALRKIFNYYGKVASHLPSFDMASDLMAEDYHFSARPNSRVLLLYTIEKNWVENAPNLSDMQPQTLSSDPDPLPIRESVEYLTSTLEIKLSSLEQLFATYDVKLKFFNGQLRPPFNFSNEYTRMRLAIDKLKEFIEFNGYKYTSVEEDKIVVSFDQNYQIVFVEFSTRGNSRILYRGSEFFLRDSLELKNSRTNKLLASLPHIYDLRKTAPPWSEFIKEFTTGIEVDFFGPPSSLTWSGTDGAIAVETQQGITPLFQTATQRQRENAAIIENDHQMINEALAESDKSSNDKLREIADEMKNIQDKAQLVEKFLNKYGLSSLIGAALECAAIQAARDGRGFPDVAKIWETVQGLDPYDLTRPPMNWQLPKLPTMLPVIGIDKAITEGIKESLREALMGALVEIVKILADMIVEMCKGYDEEDVGTGPSLAVTANQNPELASGAYEGNCLLNKYSDFGLSEELGNSFLDIVAQNVTPTESCNLINGQAGPETLLLIEGIIQSDSFDDYNIDIKDIFDTRESIEDFFVRIGECISSDYCFSILNRPPFVASPDIDPCVIEDQITEAFPDDLINVLLDAYENIDLPPGPDMGCGEGIVPSFSNMGSLMNSIINLLNAIFQTPKVIFISEIDSLKQAFVEIFPGDMDPAIWEQMEKLFEGNTEDDDAVEASNSGAGGVMKDIFSPLEDMVMGSPLIGNLNRLFSAKNAADVMKAEGLANYRVAEEYKRLYATIAGTHLDGDITGGLYSPFSPDHNAVWDQQAMDYWVRVITSPPANRAWLMVAPPDTPSVSAAPPAPGTPATLEEWGVMRLLKAVLFNQQTLNHFVVGGTAPEALPAPADYSTSQEASDWTSDLSSISITDVYFSAFISALGTMAHGVARNRLFEYEEFNNLFLGPKRCEDDIRFSIGDLFDTQGIARQAVEEFKENSCSDVPCIVGPVEDAVIFGVMSAYIQILLLQQLLKNVFFIDTYGIGNYLALPAIIEKISGEIKASIENNPYDPSSNFAMSHNISKTAIRESASIYVRKRLAQEDSPDLNELEDPFGGPNLVAPNLNYSSNAFRDFAIDYMIRKRLHGTIPAINTVFGLGGGGFEEAYLLRGLPHISILESADTEFSMTGSDPPTLVITDPPIESLQSLGFPGEILFKTRLEFEDIAEGDVEELDVDESGMVTAPPDGCSVIEQQKDLGAFAVEEYIKFDFDVDAWEKFKDSGDPDGTPLERLNYFIFEKVRLLLETTLFTDPAAAPGQQLGNSTRAIVGIESFAKFVRGLMALARRPTYEEMGEIEQFFNEMVVTYTWGEPEMWDDDTADYNEGFVPRYSAFRGPLTLENWDAIRFWLNHVQVEPMPWEDSYVPQSSTSAAMEGDPSYSEFGEAFIGSMNAISRSPDDLMDAGAGYRESGPYIYDAVGPRMQHPSFQRPLINRNLAGSINSSERDALESLGAPEDKLPTYNVLALARTLSSSLAGEQEDVHEATEYQGTRLRATVDWLWNESGQSRVLGSYITPSSLQKKWRDDPTVFRYAESVNDAAPSDLGDLSLDYPSLGYRIGTLSYNDPGGEIVLDIGRDDVTYKKRCYIPKGQDVYGFIGKVSMATNEEGESNEISTGAFTGEDGGFEVYGEAMPYGDMRPDHWSRVKKMLSVDSIYERAVLLWPGWISESEQETIDNLKSDLPSSNSAYGNTVSPTLTAAWNAWQKNKVDSLGKQAKLMVMRSFMANPTELDPSHDPDGWPVDFEVNAGGKDPYTTTNHSIPLSQKERRYASQPVIIAGGAASSIENAGRLHSFTRGYTSSDTRFKMVTGIYLGYAQSWGGTDPAMEDYKLVKYVSSGELGALIEYFTPSPASSGDNVTTTLQEDPGYTGLPTITGFLNDLISNVRAGSRVVYYTRSLGADVLATPLLERLLAPLAAYPSDDIIKSNFFATRQNCILRLSDNDVANVATNINETESLYSTINEMIQTFDPYAGTVSEGDSASGFGSYEAEGAEASRLYYDFARLRGPLAQKMVQSEGYTQLFRNSININDMGAFLFLSGLDKANTVINTYEGTSVETRSDKLSFMFDDTKRSLMTALRAALAGDSYKYAGQGRTAADSARDAALASAGAMMPMAEMGTSFILKMLIETPLNILKGLAEITDPNIIIGKSIKDVSGAIMNIVASNSGGVFTAESLAEYIQEGINMAAEEFLPPGVDPDDPAAQILNQVFLPQATKTGLKVTGKLPFIFAPPPGPLGIIYILLGLMDMEFPGQAALPCPTRPAPDPDGPTNELPSEPSTTYECPDEEES